jgi:hypothetical protein
MGSYNENSSIINIEKSRMLEPSMNLNNKQTIDRSTYRSFADPKKGTSTIFTGG